METDKIVECVPNFSEGCDSMAINAIASSVRCVPGIKLLDVNSDSDYNRTVLTFVGPPNAVQEAAFSSIKTAASLIDMCSHRGEHPCLGAIDVVPFVPVQNMPMDECVALAKGIGERVSGELGIPVYLFGAAATKPERKSLAEIRKGCYAGLGEKIKSGAWKPDFGKAEFNPRSGASVIGARGPLIAFNVDLDTDDKKKAGAIAAAVRESAGGLKEVRAIGVLLGEKGIAQVSLNLTDFRTTGLHKAFSEVERVAVENGCSVTASEIIGLVPKEALLDAGKFYSPSLGTEKALIEAAVHGLKLHGFDAEKKVLEYRL